MRHLFFWLHVAAAVDISFDVVDDAALPIFLTIPATLAVNTSSVVLSESVDCEKGVNVIFNGSSLGNRRYAPVSFFSVFPRPSAAFAIVCVDGTSIGHLEPYTAPKLIYETHPAFPGQTIEFREFANFGWSHKFPQLQCAHCDSRKNTFAFKTHVRGVPACSGRREQNNPLFAIIDGDGGAIEPFPFRVHVADNGTLESWTVSSDRLTVYDESMSKISDPIQICFYSDKNNGNGEYLGEAVFVLSENDVSGLVFFLLFIGIFFPIICIVTSVLYCFKLKNHRQFVRSVKHYIQRLQLEDEMLLNPSRVPSPGPPALP